MEFRCTKLKGFDEALSRYLLAPPPKPSRKDWLDQLCTDFDFAESQSFTSSQYVKSIEGENVGQFDVDSISGWSADPFTYNS